MFVGSLEYADRDGGTITLLMAHEFATHERTLEDSCREDIHRLLQAASADRLPAPAPSVAPGGALETATLDPAPFATLSGWLSRLG